MSEGRVVLVTGGADGIGWAIARRFAGSGDQIIVADKNLRKATERAEELGGGHSAVEMDVSNEANVLRAVAATLDDHGRLDVVVNNAGIGAPPQPTSKQGSDEFRRLLDVNLTGTFLVSRTVTQVMAANGGGAIVNISSIAGLVGLFGRNAYSASKAGIIAMTRSMACEFARHGIRINAVAPGFVETEFVRSLASSGALDVAHLTRRVPLGRLARPEEIANAVHFLCSPEASYVTGTVLCVDGGWSAFGDSGDASGAYSRPDS